jgi:hypothetical protein
VLLFYIGNDRSVIWCKYSAYRRKLAPRDPTPWPPGKLEEEEEEDGKDGKKDEAMERFTVYGAGAKTDSFCLTRKVTISSIDSIETHEFLLSIQSLSDDSMHSN